MSYVPNKKTDYPEYSSSPKRKQQTINAVLSVIVGVMVIVIGLLLWSPWDKNAEEDKEETISEAAASSTDKSEIQPAPTIESMRDSDTDVMLSPAEQNSTELPGMPQNVTIVGVESTKALVSWQVGERAQSYEVEYYSRDYEIWRADSDYVSGTSYTSTGLSRFSSYQYRIRSVNAAI